MKKYIKTTAINAVKKGLIKEGDKVWIDCTIINIDNNIITIHSHGKNIQLPENRTIRIPKPEPKPIYFGVAGRVLKAANGVTVMTTGYIDESNSFSGYLLEDTKTAKKGMTSNAWRADQSNWTDITETYKH